MRPSTYSLNRRVLLVAGIVLVVFLSSAGWVLDQAFRDSALTTVRERLTSNVFLLLGSANLDDGGQISIEEELPKPEWQVPESGHFAQILDFKGDRVWNSNSLLGMRIDAPAPDDPGNFNFQRVRSSADTPMFLLSYTVMWEPRGSNTRFRYTVQTGENEAGFEAQVRRFRRSLWGWFAGISIALLTVQTVILRWGLKPLRDLAVEVAEVENGAKPQVSGEYPSELSALSQNLNALIRSNSSNLQRYRNALGDLAHSLKTPLAVIKTALDGGSSPEGTHTTINEQVQQLDNMINYQLQRAAAAGRNAIGRPIKVSTVVTKIANSLRKVYADRNIDIHHEIIGDPTFTGDEGDLMEIIGNLADNACKWARTEVSISISEQDTSLNDAERPNRRKLILEVRDDGAGMPNEQVTEALQRGTRLDQATEGHGIGLAVVRELCEEVYQGTINIQSHSKGTTVRVSLPG